ncbi:hypothetical protein [Metallosphaera hakonensis]|uniref:hypothetical protein n=1 Tax=Metallosphaera hakonensis TaxID=79601 RepID=UPI000A60BCB4|nr:hypothetical protein [Metallosphaera hakonensis]
MISLMDDNVGGVSVNVRNAKTGNIFYLAELIERLKETTMRAVNGSGYAVLLNGKCSLYRTELVKPFILSEEYRNPTFMEEEHSLETTNSSPITSFLRDLGP